MNTRSAKVVFFVAALLCGALGVGCQQDMTADLNVVDNGTTTLSVSLEETRTAMGDKRGDSYPLYWSEGDRVAVNGYCSEEVVINVENRSLATFSVGATLGYPYKVTYPYASTTTVAAPQVLFAAEQSYEAGTFASGLLPMCGYAEGASDNISMKYLGGVLRLTVKSAGGSATISRVEVESGAKEPLSGTFAVDCKAGVATPTDAVSSTILYTCNATVTASESAVFHIVVPAAVYSGTGAIRFVDSEGGVMTCRWVPGEIRAGVVREYKSIPYSAGKSASLEPLDAEYDAFIPDGMAFFGFVKDTSGRSISGVVVSDGETCVQTDEQGYYAMVGNKAETKFVFASVPSGYKALSNEYGAPQFFHEITATEKASSRATEINFVFEPIASDPNRYTILMGADPQPRARSKGDDKVAFHSLDVCEDLYRDMRDVRATISGREVYGMMLGDIVHEDMSLYSNYVDGMATLNFPMFNVIGNHDHDLSATTDVEGARRFEENFGPSYYSFNIGKQHFVVLDNVIMTVIEGKLKKNEYSYGLTDKQWQWLQNDLSYVDKSTMLMIASHIPLFKKDSAEADFQDQSAHGADYTNLFASYDKVHVWAGHTHRTFNYNYSSKDQLRNVEVHTLARSTGELWTNEYLAYGTPRGYTIIDVDGNNVSWQFKPLSCQRAPFVGNDYETKGQPAYVYRDWDYNAAGEAILRGTNTKLDSNYQIKAWKDGLYVYAHVFMWDDKWSKPKFNGNSMSNVDRQSSGAKDLAFKEIVDFYWANSMLSGYSYSYDPVYHNAIFRIFNMSSSGSGTVTVTDRFGNEYSTTLEW